MNPASTLEAQRNGARDAVDVEPACAQCARVRAALRSPFPKSTPKSAL
jgi:hypothetical protein